MTRQEERDVQAAAERLSGLIVEAVAQTLEQRSPEPARTYVGVLTDAASPEQERATDLMVTLILVRWLSVVREQVPDAERVEDVLGWVGTALGPRYAARARYTSSPLVSDDVAADIMQYRNALRGDFLPSLVWQVAGAVAVYGEGEVDWLRQLVGVAAPAG